MNHIVLLAAGKGTRMKSDLPKVLTPVLGVPIIVRLLENIRPVCEKPTLIVGHKADDVIVATGNKYHYVLQKEQLGTGHAIMMAKKALEERKDIDTVVVLMGDMPLVKAATVEKLISNHKKSGATITMGTTIVENYAGDRATFEHFGRVIRDIHGNVDRIVEYKDATPEEREVKEVNVSYYCFDARWLWENIDKIMNDNTAQEYYLTDIVWIAKQQGKRVDAFAFSNIECLGINTPEQLKQVEEAIAQAQA